jgi:hypothetical protein
MITVSTNTASVRISRKTSNGEIVRKAARKRVFEIIQGPYKDADMEILRIQLRTCTRSNVFSGIRFKKLLRSEQTLSRDGASMNKPDELWYMVKQQTATVLSSSASDRVKHDQRKLLLESMAALQHQREIVAVATNHGEIPTVRMEPHRNC